MSYTRISSAELTIYPHNAIVYIPKGSVGYVTGSSIDPNSTVTSNYILYPGTYVPTDIYNKWRQSLVEKSIVM
jgi:hypothetical protein